MFRSRFHDRDPVSLGEEPVQLSIGPVSGRYHLVDIGYYTHMVDQAPLNRRAWVVQERLLSVGDYTLQRKGTKIVKWRFHS